MRLGKRLQQIDRMVLTGYHHIWDCCCDHGLLGATLLQRNAAAHIHFVDVVPELMQALSTKLQKHAAAMNTNSRVDSAVQPAQWHTHCADAGTLPLQRYPGKHLLIIAGVGGELTAALVAQISAAHPELELEFILCPVRQQFLLRKQLIALQCALIDEVLVSENRRYYELLHVLKPAALEKANSKHPKECGQSEGVTTKGIPIHQVGSALWHAHSEEHAQQLRRYLANTLRHYHAAKNQAAVAAYQNVKIQWAKPSNRS